MRFSMHIEVNEPPPGRCEVADALSSDDPLVGVLATVCDCLEGHPGVRFIVSGFGQEAWPVGAGVDLAIVLEQIPGVLRGIHAGQEVSLDFYEQGIERTIWVRAAGDKVELECASGTDWEPRPRRITMSTSSLVAELAQVRDEFIRLLARVAPESLQHPDIRRWAQAERLRAV